MAEAQQAKPDELWLADDGNFDLVVPKSPLARILGYLGSVALILAPGSSTRPTAPTSSTARVAPSGS